MALLKNENELDAHLSFVLEYFMVITDYRNLFILCPVVLSTKESIMANAKE